MRKYGFFDKIDKIGMIAGIAMGIGMFQTANAASADSSLLPSLLPSIESIAVMGDVGHTQLVIRTPQKIFYEINSDNSHQTLTLILYDINPVSWIPTLDLNNKAIQNIQYNISSENQLVLTLSLAPSVEVQSLRIAGDHPAELVLDVGIGAIPYIPSKTQKSDLSGSYEPLVKTPAPLSPEEITEQNYEEAVNLLNQNNTDSAVLLFQSILHQHPDFEKARVTLAETYLSQNKPQLALDTLKAITVTDTDSDAHAAYYTALAEGYRQTGDPSTASDIYQRLLKNHPDNAIAWVGLGMCLDMLHQLSDAHAAYLKADRIGNLSVSLQQYVSHQLTKDSGRV